MASKIAGPLKEMLARNSKWSETYKAPPTIAAQLAKMRGSGQGVIILSCSDPRLFPEQIFGLDSQLRATMVRNAGGRASDALRTLQVLQTLGGAKTIVVMHHTDCGLTNWHDDHFRRALQEVAPQEKEAIEKMEFGEIINGENSLREDVALIEASPLFLQGTQVIGLMWDTFKGTLQEIE